MKTFAELGYKEKIELLEAYKNGNPFQVFIPRSGVSDGWWCNITRPLFYGDKCYRVKPEVKVMWANIYKNYDVGHFHASLEDCKRGGCEDSMGIIRMEQVGHKDPQFFYEGL